MNEKDYTCKKINFSKNNRFKEETKILKILKKKNIYPNFYFLF